METGNRLRWWGRFCRLGSAVMVVGTVALYSGMRSGMQARISSVDAQSPAPLAVSVALRTQFVIAGKASIRILIRRAGWYRVTWHQLTDAGMPQRDVSGLELFDHSVQVPILTTGLPSGSAFDFYGAALDTPTTNVRTYWLTSGISTPLRLSETGTEPAPGVRPTRSFTAQAIHAEHQTYYPLALATRPDDFFGPLLAGAPVTQSIAVTDLRPQSSSRLRIGLQGVATGPHRVTVAVNGVAVGAVSFSGTALVHQALSLRPGILHDGANRIELAPSTAHGDQSLLGALGLQYQRLLVARGNRLAFAALRGRAVELTGFSTRAIRVLDVTNSSDVHDLAPVVQPHGTGYAAFLRIPGSGNPTLHRLLAVGGSTTSVPLQVVANHPTDWHAANHGADLIVLGYEPFLAAAAPLIALRRAQGLSVAVVDVQDVFDEFGFGDHGPQAIRDFLQTAASTWTRSPRYVLLIGGASFDPKGYLGKGRDDFVPTQLLNVGNLRVPSDQWLIDFNGNGISSIALGRLAVRSAAEVRTVVAKIVAYHPASELPSALLVAGDNHADDTTSFSAANTLLAGLLPSTITPDLIDEHSVGTSAPAAVRAAINHGPLLVNFLGHGNVNYWAHLLNASTARTLQNGSRLPVFVMMTCLSGMFADPGVASLSQDLMAAPKGGAVAVWSSTGETGAEGEIALNEAFFRQLGTGSNQRLGDAIVAASARATDPDVRRTWELFGDPTMPLP